MRPCDHLDCEEPAAWTPKMYVFTPYHLDPRAEHPIEGQFPGGILAVCDGHRDPSPSLYFTREGQVLLENEIKARGLVLPDWSRTVIEFEPLEAAG